MRKEYSLAQRLQLVVAGVLIFTLGAVGTVFDRSFTASAEKAAIDRLDLHLYALLGSVEISDSGVELPVYITAQQFNNVNSGLYAVMLNYDSEIEWASSSIQYADTFLSNSNMQLPRRGQKVISIGDDSVEPLFMLSYGIAWETAGQLKDYVVVVGESMGSYNDLVLSYRQTLWGWLCGAGLLLLLVQFFVLHYTLNPLRLIVSDLADIQDGRRESLGEDFPQELSSLITSVNDLVDYEAKQKEYYRNNLANLAHSLKTPLAVLRAGISEPNLDQLRGEFSIQIDNLNQLINYQLQRSIIPSGKLMSKPVQLLTVVSKLRRTLEKVYAGKQLQITVNIDNAENFYGDEHDIYEVLGNLMENACKYTDTKVVVATESTPGHKKKKQCCIIVEDDGSGIPPDEVESALSRGVRLDSQNHGQGIGLAMVADLVEGYKGEIKIEKSELGGCRFVVVI
jgi:two-component system sensor histidine kinase PhoQ|tara:strand:+ start:674 stop:2032 length:1359 start_codon:yes stop_codon:yes gene_type:complete